MKRIAFWPYQLYAFLVFYPIGLLLTLLSGWLTMVAAIIWNPEFASRYIASNWARLICWLTPVRVEVEGAENAEPGKSFVVVCNHQGLYDIFLVYGWLKLDLKWVMKAELRKIPGVGIGCEKAGHIFVDRSNPEQARKAVTDALDRVGDGVGLLFFAEGTRSPDGKMLPFKKGAFRVAADQNLPILPVTVIGTRNIQKPRSILIFPGKIRMVIHPAVDINGRREAGDILGLMTQTRDTIASALPEELR
jgi:1-acyl-sn-glycerol-3-phosphate acyltransferase